MGYVPQAFGKANRPSTPIQGIISNNYAANYAEEQELVEDKGRSSRPPIGGKMTRARELAIKNQQDKKSKIEYEEKQFKMRRFANVDTRISTRRNQSQNNIEIQN